jgi:hypothetical protein
MDKDLRELANQVKSLNVMMVSLLIGFEALRDLGRANRAAGARSGPFKRYFDDSADHPALLESDNLDSRDGLSTSQTPWVSRQAQRR